MAPRLVRVDPVGFEKRIGRALRLRHLLARHLFRKIVEFRCAPSKVIVLDPWERQRFEMSSHLYAATSFW